MTLSNQRDLERGGRALLMQDDAGFCLMLPDADEHRLTVKDLEEIAEMITDAII